MRPTAFLLACALCGGCRDRGPEGGAIQLTVNRPQLDPVGLRASAVGVRCTAGNGLLIRGVAEAQGVLIWLVTAGGPDTGAFTVHAVADSVLGRQARVSVRYVAGDTPHAFALDSGTVTVGREAQSLSGAIGGSGSDPADNLRPLVQGGFQRVLVLPDSEPCRTAAE